MCQPLCKLLGSQLSYLTAPDVKLETSQLAKAPNATIGLLFAPEPASLENDARSRMSDLRDALVELHRELKKREDVSFEVVLIPTSQSPCPQDSSSHHPSPSSTQHFFSQKESPFLLLSAEIPSKTQEYLVRKYEIQETPALVLVGSSEAQVILYDAKERVMEDPKGVLFPWRYPSLSELLKSASLLRNTGADSSLNYDKYEQSNNDSVRQSTILNIATETEHNLSFHAPVKALLFAAFWCPPCKTFLTALLDLYHTINKNEKRLEIIFVSSDRSQESFNRFFSLMPWLAISYEDSKLRDNLTKMFNVKAIPNLTILDENNQVITREGRQEVNDDMEGIEFPWYPRIVDELRDRHSTVLNNNLCMIYFTDDTEADYERAEALLTPIVVEIEKSDVTEAYETKCFVAADSDLAESLRIFMDLDETLSYLVLMDIANFRYAVNELPDRSKLSTATAKEFLLQFQSDKLVYKYIQSRFV